MAHDRKERNPPQNEDREPHKHPMDGGHAMVDTIYQMVKIIIQGEHF